MARQEQRDKRRRRERSRPTKRPVRREVPPAGEASPAGVRSVEIVDEPLPDPHEGALKPRERRQLDVAYDAFHAAFPDGFDRAAEEADMLEALAQFERVNEALPHLRMPWNHRAMVLEQLGRHEEANALICETFERFPDYPAGVTNYASLKLAEGDLDAVAAIFEAHPSPMSLQPWRKVFHLSEIVNYQAMFVRYLVTIENAELAEQQFDLLHQMAPDHPQVLQLDEWMQMRGLANLMEMAETGTFPRQSVEELRDGIAENWLARYDAIVAETDRACAALDDPKLTLPATELATELCLDGSGADRGEAKSWAAGIVHVLLQVNGPPGLDADADEDVDANRNMEEVARIVGVSPSTASAKASIIRKRVPDLDLDPSWSRPGEEQRHPILQVARMMADSLDRHAGEDV